MTETAIDLMHRLGLNIPGAGLAGALATSPVLREQANAQQREQDYCTKALTLGLTQDDARMVLDREKQLADEYRFTREQMIARAWTQAIAHSTGEPYRPFQDDAEQLWATARLVGIRDAEQHRDFRRSRPAR